ncbi:LamG-like jellyroll fold domain-containing protein [Flavilitoribacter nigricans]|uniref:LamG-like jellyroll fold domain-containing protein n=1 Tax=Flavilitoribacter nigricans (strain ATCC 23147 / DSM 23189 / NBRC 102662 / NCIMB 1420 / SS-2) TaxID=1122177 RepID=A0A2D0NGE5_FLAN2|nr:LamG-like jellyroll fold domain-containing protein [Flavilitoribacter nigricans]PHN07572.1 hypothetical protein CRP01_05580 [Flavilitoribacter nigricans DSM 23189 = NBRC 102662]
MLKPLRFLLLLTFWYAFLPGSQGQSPGDFLQLDLNFTNGSLLDASPNMTVGTGVNLSSAIGVEGEANSAFQFNGTTSFIDLGTDNRGITNQLTMSAWVKTTSLKRQVVLAKYDVNDDAGYSLSVQEGLASMEGRDGSGFFHQILLDNYLINDDRWHHIIGIIDQNHWRLYVDCQLVNELITTTEAPLLTTTDSLTIGKLSVPNNDNDSRFFDGQIDNVKLYNTALRVEQLPLISDYSCADCEMDLNAGLIAYYPLDGDGLDQSGNELHGTVGGALPTQNQLGEEERAMRFDGVDDYILVANNDLLNFGTGEFAVSLWAQSDNPSNGPQMLIQKGVSGNIEVNPHFFIRLNDFLTPLQVMGTVTDGYPPASSIGIQNSPFADRNWHHIVFQRTATYLELWVDGELAASEADTQFRNVSGSGNLIIGAQNPWDFGGNYPYIHSHLNGRLDEIRIYNRALCGDDILALGDMVSRTEPLPLEVGEVKLYPNPVSDWLTIQLDFKQRQRTRLRLIDLNGRILWQEQWQGSREQLRKNLADLPAGMYTLQLYLTDHQLLRGYRFVKL